MTYTYFRPYEPELSQLQKATNAANTCADLVRENPGNGYWLNRLYTALCNLLALDPRTDEQRGQDADWIDQKQTFCL